MSFINIIGDIFKPAAELIGNMHTSDEERMQAQTALERVQNAITSQMIELQAQILASQTTIITAEAQGQSWGQRNWRPITMLTFLVLVVADTFGITEHRLAEEAWTLLQLGLGGYVVGRSAEKIAPAISSAIKKRGQ